MAKTRRVEIPRLVRHPKYGKILRRKTVCHVHDEAEEAHVGDTVEIRESRPRSQDQALGAGARGDQEPAGRHRGHAGRGPRTRKRSRRARNSSGLASERISARRPSSETISANDVRV